MGAIFGLILLIFAVLFIIGIAMIVMVAIVTLILVIKRIIQNQRSEPPYRLVALFIIIGVVLLIPMGLSKLYMNNAISEEDLVFKVDKTVNINYETDNLTSFKLNGTKYVSLTDPLERDTNWTAIYISENEYFTEKILGDKPIARIKYHMSLDERNKDSEGFIDLVMATFYLNDTPGGYLYNLQNGNTDFLVATGYDSFIYGIYFPEDKFNQYFNYYSDINNYTFTLDSIEGKNLSIELSKKTIKELHSNAKELLDFSDARYSEEIDYQKISDEKGFKSKVLQNDNIVDDIVTINAENKEIGFYGTLSNLYMFDNDIYQVEIVYGNENEDDDRTFLVYIKLSDNSKKELRKIMQEK